MWQQPVPRWFLEAAPTSLPRAVVLLTALPLVAAGAFQLGRHTEKIDRLERIAQALKDELLATQVSVQALLDERAVIGE